MTIHIVEMDEPRARASLEYVLQHLDTEDHELEKVFLDRVRRLGRESRHVEKKFQHTPEPLLESWRAARHLTALTQPGDVVLMSDHRGLGGVFALEQASADQASRRVLWTVAADSAFLEMRLVAATHEGFPLPLDSQIDWEITQYRWSERIIATSDLAATNLSVIDVGAELLVVAPTNAPASRPIDTVRVWAPGPVSRRNLSGEVLRAITSVTDSVITLSDADWPDAIWSGSSWEALRHSREVLGNRVNRQSGSPQDPTVVVLGDPYAPPDPFVIELRDAGVPVVVASGSVAQMMWPDAPTWRQADDLASVLSGSVGASPATDPAPTPRKIPSLDPDRARAVSVAIPVFRDVRFLAECVESVLAQEQAPVELLLVDDGSASDDVAQVLDDIAVQDERVRVLTTEHRGVCAARNTAIEAMNGDSFLLVDSDDIVDATFIGRCAEVMRGSSEVWAVATWTEFFGEYEAIEAKPPFDGRVGMRENPIISTPVLVDIAVREKGIRFAPDLAFLYCEDWHFWSQIVAAGGRFGLVPQPLARHRVHPSSGGYLRTELAHAVGKSRATEPLREPT